MADDSTPPRRRKLPVLGMTTVGLAVGAGSLGLYRGAAAEQTPPPADQPTWTTAVRAAIPPEETAPEPSAPEPSTPAVIAASYAEPAEPPAPLAATVTTPPAAVLPVIPVMPAVPALPVAPEAPAVPVIPVMAMPEVPGTPATTPALTVPVLPMIPTAAEKPAVESPKVPAPVVPALAAKQWPQVPEIGETLPLPREVKPVASAPIPVAPAKSMPVVPAKPMTVELPSPLPVMPVAPVVPPAQSVQLPAKAVPVTPNAPAKPELNLLPSQPSFNVNGEPESKPSRQAPGVLSSLKSEPPGDAPVKPTLQSLKAAAVGAALAAAPVNAADPPVNSATPKAEAAKVADSVADLKAEVQKLREDAALERKFRLAIEDMVNGTRDNETGKAAPGLTKKFADLDTRLKALEDKFATFDAAKFQATLDRLDTKLTELGKPATTVQKPDKPADAAPKPMPGPKPAIAAGKASVRIVNEFPVPISLKVNDKSYRVEPNGSEVVEVPAGEYTYELLNTGSPVVTRTLKESQSETLRIK
jgi:hypothetical protein